MRFRKICFVFWVILVCWFSIEILFRRWIFGQIPTQIAPWLVYGLLLVNGIAVWSKLKEDLARRVKKG